MGTKGGQIGVPRSYLPTLSVEGERFGHLTALGEDGGKWKFRCDCGNVVSLPLRDVIAGDITDCGCGGIHLQPESQLLPPRGKAYAKTRMMNQGLTPGKQTRLELPDGSTMLVLVQKREAGVMYLCSKKFANPDGVRAFPMKDYEVTWRLYPARVNVEKVYKKLTDACLYNEGVLCDKDKRHCHNCGWYSQYLKGVLKREEEADRKRAACPGALP